MARGPRKQQDARGDSVTWDRWGIPGLSALGRRHSVKAQAGFQKDLHPGDFEFTVVLRGRQVIAVGEETHALRGGEGLLTHPGEAHSSAGFPRERCHLAYVRVHTRGKGPWLAFIGEEARRARRALEAFHPRHFPAHTAAPHLAEALKFLETGAPFLETRVSDSLTRFVLTVLGQGTGGNPIPDGILQAREYLDAHTAEEISVADLADKAGYSPSRFHQLFLETVGYTPGDYATRQRLAEATKRLTRTELPIQQIALDLGWPSSQYFATVFRRYMARSPQAWRKQGRGI